MLHKYALVTIFVQRKKFVKEKQVLIAVWPLLSLSSNTNSVMHPFAKGLESDFQQLCVLKPTV